MKIGTKTVTATIAPILGLPLLLGGVTGAEFWRLVLVLLKGLAVLGQLQLRW
jgi:hypothetical protein